MFPDFEPDGLNKQLSQENLLILFISAVFDALKDVFGLRTAKRFLKNDLTESWEGSGFKPEVSLYKKAESLKTKKFVCSEACPANEPVDLFRETYNRIFPRAVRHALGEYYTPPWLADRILDSVSYCLNGFESLLDPCCGSGVFLLQGLKRILRRTSQEGKAVTAPLIVQNLIGRDVNPVSVFACKANLRINVYRLTGLVLPDRMENVQCADFLKENVSQSSDAISEQYDVAAGNPPWIAWDNLPADYRRDTERLWRRYNLFHLTGSAARHGGAKKDLSELIFYASCDRLKPNGRIGFVLPKSLFFTLAAGGFRRWTLPNGDPVKIESVEDFSQLNLFGTPAAKACAVTASKGDKTSYPVRYTNLYSDKYLLQNCNAFSSQPKLKKNACLAQPSDPSDPLSVWSVFESKAQPVLPSQSDVKRDVTSYIARLGANSGGANGVYWLTVLDVVDQSRVRVRNLAQCSKKNVPEVETIIESALLYPLARWKSVGKGVLDLDETVILVVQDPIKRTGLGRELMETKYPLALNYLLQFEELLSNRAAQKRFQSRGEFYSMYNVGQYTFSDWKCVWRRMDSRIRAAAVGPRSVAGLPPRPVFPQETCVFIPAQSEPEACYLSAIMNSSAVNALACSTSCAGGKSFGSPSLLSRIPLVQFDANNPVHAQLAALGRLLSQTPDDERIQKEIDRLTPDGGGANPRFRAPANNRSRWSL
ncbi:MAG: N-6 DNA methylase [Thermoguttaceae bacterium]|nr:N-6 DNA methylase [Thermoguttaceae bacterium]